jgi:hypothetical protein
MLDGKGSHVKTVLNNPTKKMAKISGKKNKKEHIMCTNVGAAAPY